MEAEHAQKIEEKINDLFLKSSEVDSLLDQTVSNLYHNIENKEKVSEAINALEGIRKYHNLAITEALWQIENNGIIKFLKG